MPRRRTVAQEWRKLLKLAFGLLALVGLVMLLTGRPALGAVLIASVIGGIASIGLAVAMVSDTVVHCCLFRVAATSATGSPLVRLITLPFFFPLVVMTGSWKFIYACRREARYSGWLRGKIASPNALDRWRAAVVLAESRDKLAIPELMVGVEDRDKLVARECAIGLGIMGGNEAMTCLERTASKAEDDGLWAASVAGICRLGGTVEVDVPRLERYVEMLRATRPLALPEIVLPLTFLPLEVARVALSKLLQLSFSKGDVLASLLQVHGSEGVPFVEPFLRAQDDQCIRTALLAVIKQPRREFRATVAELVSSGPPSTRSMAQVALLKIDKLQPAGF